MSQGNTYANSFISPKFIKAKTAKELEKLMLKNNVESHRQYHYTIVVMNNEFYAWYDYDHKDGSVQIARGK